MIKLCVAGTPAVLEPSAAASATTKDTRFLGNTALDTPLIVQRQYTLHRGHSCENSEFDMDGITDADTDGVAPFKQPDKRIGGGKICSHRT